MQPAPLHSGDASVALGKGASATGSGAAALGMFTRADGLGSTAAVGAVQLEADPGFNLKPFKRVSVCDNKTSQRREE
jgi:hypothetical protein